MGRVVVLGARGMLGTDLMAACAADGLDACGFDLPEFDVTDGGQVRAAVDGADAIVNCAAYTNVEKAESEREIAFKVNGQAVGQLGAIAAENDIPVLHISTDFVFDGQLDRPYVESDAVNPISAYGASKLDGEEQLFASGCKGCVIRVQWTYGAAGTNFVKKLIDAARAGKPLKVVDDQVGSPTATTEVAAAIVEFLKKDAMPEGLFHFAAAGYASRYEMAEFIFDKLNMKVDLTPCKSSDFKTAAQRPLNSKFDCRKIEAVLGKQIKLWQEPLEKFLQESI